MATSDKHYVDRCLDGHPDEFRHLVKRYHPVLMAHLVGQLGSADRAEEAVQETFVRSYFNLPKATKDTGLALWADFDERLLESARTCAEGVIADLRNRRFWPPAAKVPYDDFEALFPASVSNGVDVAGFESFLKGI